MMHKNAAGWTCFPPLPPDPSPKTELGIDDTLRYIASQQNYIASRQLELRNENLQLRKEMAAMRVARKEEKDKAKRDEAQSKKAFLVLEVEMKQKDDELARLNQQVKEQGVFMQSLAKLVKELLADSVVMSCIDQVLSD